MIKPDAVEAALTGEILAQIERNGFVIQEMRMHRMSPGEAELFYDAHRKRPFFHDLVEFMVSGPVVQLVLGHTDTQLDVIAAWRTCMGTTDPNKASIGTMRYIFGTDLQRNAVHGSDSPEAAAREITLCFPHLEDEAFLSELHASYCADCPQEEDEVTE